MRKNFGVKPYLYPMPVLIIGSYDADGVANAMNAAWGGISEVNQISICVDDTHKTADNIAARGAFTVSIGTAAQMVACDFVGMVTGHELPDKLLEYLSHYGSYRDHGETDWLEYEGHGIWGLTARILTERFKMADIELRPLEADDREQFIKDNQEAFKYGAMEEFGMRDDH